ncbi:hypothetical protein Bbelb_043170 [Branchiostoma belcheri]|nr:hypothetical protein Bbelb_043170 [Branchiostoma belcheri]
MEHSPVPLLIKQEPVDADVANQEAVGSSGHESGEPPREDAWEDYPTHWQAAEGVVSIGQASRIRTPLRGRLYVCSECEYHATRADVIKHQRLHTRARPYVCLLCNFAGTQNSHLRSHFKRHHFTPLDEDNHMIIPQSHFICQECHIIFPTQEKLQTHLCQSHTNEEQTPANSEETENSDDMQVDSLQKDHVGKQNGALESIKHVNNVLHRNNEQNSPPRSDSCATSKHMTSSSVPPTDDGCGYKGGKKDVQKHLTVHTGFRPYVCLQCGHTTAQNNHMRKHFQRIHPGQEAEFDESSPKVLTKVHTDCTFTVDRQMACNFCPYKTSKKELLRLHMRRHLWMS